MSPIVVRVVRAPFERRARAELLYVLIGAVLAVAGVGYLLVSFVLSAGLAITVIGIPLIALTVLGARSLGGVHRRLAAGLLGERVAAPEPFRGGSGLYGWVQSGLGDGPGWRAIGCLLIKLPVMLLAGYVVVFTWVWGVVGVTYPLQHALGVNQFQALDNWPMALLVAVAGAALLLAAPWAVRAVLVLDRLLIHRLLGPDESSRRIRDLEETRATAVEGAALALRRIERDLHDGAQVRLVALTMHLTMIREGLGPEASLALRDLVSTAQGTAKEAIVELRDLVRGIHPPVLDAGLEAALAGITSGSGLPVSLTVDLPARPSPAIETIAYFCVAELLANAAKHSGAHSAAVTVTSSHGRLRLRVSDDGAGGARLGTGLAGLTDRVRTVDGSLHLTSPPGGPTVVTVDLPIHA
jgi:signal transduction histidine kinase